MNLTWMVKKIREKGVSGTWKAFMQRLIMFSENVLISWYQKRYPIQQNLILLESDGDLMDNGYALFDYMNHNCYLDKYHVVWMVTDVDKTAKYNFSNTEYLPKFPKSIDCKWAKTLAMNIPQQVYRLSEKAVPPFRGKCTAYPPRCTAYSLGYDVKII